MTGTDFKDLFRNIEKRENPNYENVEELDLHTRIIVPVSLEQVTGF